jgi:predicted NBD/HSP70 family sugar kinase
MKRSATASLMRKLNCSAVLDLIREQSPIARSEIARQLNMSIPTVMRVIDDLFADDLVRWSGDSQVSGGRPRTLLEFNGHAYAVIGLDLGGAQLYGTLADLCGSIQDEICVPLESADPVHSLEQVCGLVEDLLSRPRPAGQIVRGIGVGAPGVTLSNQGVVTWAPSLGWRDLPLRDILQQRFGLPVVVENDVNLAAIGEYGFGAARGATSAVCIAIGTGIGSGIVIDGKIYRGYRQSAGEVGYLPPAIPYLARSYDSFGALEGIASATGLQQRARRALESSSGQFQSADLSAEGVFEAALQGESWAQQLLDETVDYLSLAVAAVSAILDPQVIVLGGAILRAARGLAPDLLIEPILSRLEGVLPSRPNLVGSQLGSRAAVMGAIMLVLEMTTERVTLKDWT